MKTINHYISLLFISGLILQPYRCLDQRNNPALKRARKHQHSACTRSGYNIQDTNTFHFSFINDVIGKLVPAVKNLN